ncbi:hypothetical protein F511_43079 [Dorcoceras hygrometricum]|uniref:Uncharacterized protein n=1 Tax=Dorcoceras hygrometricum TaxID=472368 RepID=A0A2Z6ZZZ0_9LAMI|nr:hypothetical protein F511_43079 [Dorcoceras hygrometricum]
MADIAILVAEEYERRIKVSRKSGQDIELWSCVGLLGKNLREYSSCLFRDNFYYYHKGESSVKLLVGIEEPKSPISLAATYGFFSA